MSLIAKTCDEEPLVYTGVPAPVVLSNDSWFGPVTYKISKARGLYATRETEMKMQEQKRREEAGEEPDDIHRTDV